MPSAAGPKTIMDALASLMETVQGEAETFHKLMAIYRDGGESWQALLDKVESLYAEIQERKKASAEPGDEPAAEPAAEPGKSDI